MVHFLGIQDHAEARHALVVAQCGWDRVGMTMARIQLLPESHPLTVMLGKLPQSTAHTWWDQARDWLSSLQLRGTFPNCSFRRHQVIPG